MGKLKQLASDTAIYGISSILGRVLSYLLVSVHTDIFATAEYGIVGKLYAYTALFNVICTFGMETAFFRYASRFKEKRDFIFYQANFYVIFLSLFITGLVFFNASEVVNFLDYPGREQLVQWLAIIIFIDAVVAIPFARIRLENRPKFFALVRISSIVLTVLLNLFFLYALPSISKGQYLAFLQPLAQQIYDHELGVGYIFLANLIGNAIMIIFLWKYLLALRINIPWQQLKPMLKYAIPIVIIGLAGGINEQLDKILLEELWPTSLWGFTGEQALGIYAACFKLSVFMLLAIQAFRYAAEPFFFSNAEDKQGPALFARVMYFFVLLSLVIFVGVSLNVDLIGFIFLRQESYRVGLFVVPYLLLGKLFFGVYVNLSIWYKLTDKTVYGVYFSVLGAIITIIGNLLLIPVIGFLGSAITAIVAYLGMSMACYFVGQKHFTIPYNVKAIAWQVLIAIVVVVIFFNIKFENTFVNYTIGFLGSITYMAYLFFSERNKLKQIAKKKLL
ncbi:MAG: lipopolysaccharide biosynthesis protein [Cyclobacteriaceae bacterium]